MVNGLKCNHLNVVSYIFTIIIISVNVEFHKESSIMFLENNG